MKIEILGWSSEGFRCPDVRVALNDKQGRLFNVSLIQMPNGTGKTTTLELLRATLSGDINQLEKKGLRQLARKDASNTNGEFSVDLRIDDDHYNITLEVDFENNSHDFYTTSPQLGGRQNEFNLPQSARKFFTKEFLDLFLFDAEFQQSIFDSRASAADSAINALCQIYIMDEIQIKANQTWREQAEKNDTTRSERGLNSIRIELEKARKRQEQLKDLQTEAQSFIHENSELHKKQQAEIRLIEETKDKLFHEKESAAVAVENGKEELKNCEDKFLEFLRNVYSTSEENSNLLNSLYNSLEINKLPETTSKQFFIDLARSPECICGRAIGEEHKKFIEDNSQNYLSSNTSGVMNQIKGKIEDYKDENFDEAALGKVSNDVKEARRALVQLNENYERADNAIKEAGGEKLRKMGEEANALNSEIEKKRQLIERLNSEHDTRKPLKQIDITSVFSLDSIGLKIDELEAREAKITDTVDLKEKIGVLDTIIKNATFKAQSTIKSELKEKCNARLATLLINDPLTIESIEKSINFEGQDGASAGQQLTVAYTFLMSLLERGGNQFPLIVDSPAGPLDLTVRANVGALIPKICDQYIAFTINTEHPGFVPAMKASCNSIKFLTLFRKTEGTKRFIKSLPTGRFLENENGVLVDDEEYFDNFDISEEE